MQTNVCQAFTRSGGIVLIAGLLLGVGSVPAAQAIIANCGDALGPGNVTLEADVGPCATDPALTYTGPGKFDLNGFTVSCSTTATDGIVLQAHSSKLMNGTVTGCDDGVIVGGDLGNHKVKDVTSQNNADDGFQVDSNVNVLTRTTALNNGDEGHEINGMFNKIEKSSAMMNNDGFDFNGDNNVVRDSTAMHNNHGFETDGEGNRLLNNQAVDNNADGFLVGSDLNKLEENMATGNFRNGIVVCANGIADCAGATATINTIVDNTATGNNVGGVGAFDLIDENANCDLNKWQGNTFATSNQGCIN